MEAKASKGERDPPLFIKQTIGNACGTIALLHALCNTLDHCGGVGQDSFLEKFLMEASTPEERAKFIEADSRLEVTHETMAQEGATDPKESMDTKCHFVTYVAKDGAIWELDGRLSGPVCKAPIEPGQHLGVEVSKIIKGYIAMNNSSEGSDLKFSVMALAPAGDDLLY